VFCGDTAAAWRYNSVIGLSMYAIPLKASEIPVGEFLHGSSSSSVEIFRVA